MSNSTNRVIIAELSLIIIHRALSDLHVHDAFIPELQLVVFIATVIVTDTSIGTLHSYYLAS